MSDAAIHELCTTALEMFGVIVALLVAFALLGGFDRSSK